MDGVLDRNTRQILQVRVTRHPTAEWRPSRSWMRVAGTGTRRGIWIRDRDGRFGIKFDRRVQRLGVKRIRTPIRAPRAIALAERWVRSARTECLDHRVIVDEGHLQRVLGEYVAYFNCVATASGVGPTSAVRIRSTGGGHPPPAR